MNISVMKLIFFAVFLTSNNVSVRWLVQDGNMGLIDNIFCSVILTFKNVFIFSYVSPRQDGCLEYWSITNNE